MNAKTLVLLCLVLLLALPSTLAVETITPFLSVFATNGSTVHAINGPDVFRVQPGYNETWIIHRMTVQVQDNAVFTAEGYGGLSALTNGIVVRTNRTNVISNLTGEETVKSLSHWARYSYDLALQGFGSGDNFANVRWSFDKAGTSIFLNGTKNESIDVVINDELTGLTGHTFLFQGRNVTANEFAKEEETVASATGLFVIPFLFVIGMLMSFTFYYLNRKEKSILGMTLKLAGVAFMFVFFMLALMGSLLIIQVQQTSGGDSAFNKLTTLVTSVFEPSITIVTLIMSLLFTFYFIRTIVHLKEVVARKKSDKIKEDDYGWPEFE